MRPPDPAEKELIAWAMLVGAGAICLVLAAVLALVPDL
jgi:hypothetical protein